MGSCFSPGGGSCHLFQTWRNAAEIAQRFFETELFHAQKTAPHKVVAKLIMMEGRIPLEQ